MLHEIRRYPVKAMGGESLAAVRIDSRGLTGDRAYAVVDGDGKLATGKHSRRFRRRDEIFEFAARTVAGGIRVTGRDGEWSAPSAEVDRMLSDAMGDAVRLLPEAGTPYFDAGQVSLVSTASLEWCRVHLGVDADRRRIRPNLVVDSDDPFVEESWSGEISIGDVLLCPVERIERCRMIDVAQEGLPQEGRWLKSLTAAREMCLGVYLDVARSGTVAAGDEVLVRGAG
jgi:uncharacterized protein